MMARIAPVSMRPLATTAALEPLSNHHPSALGPMRVPAVDQSDHFGEGRVTTSLLRGIAILTTLPTS